MHHFHGVRPENTMTRLQVDRRQPRHWRPRGADTATALPRTSIPSVIGLAFVIVLICKPLGETLAQSAETVILPPGSTWEYTFSDPTSDPDWNRTTGGWATGPAPFGSSPGLDPNFEAGTAWPADDSDGDDLWIRTTVDLSKSDLSAVVWQLGVDNGFTLYVNGKLAGSANAEGYASRWEYSDTFPADALVAGENVIALALEDHGGATAFDMQVTGRPGASAPRIVTADPPYSDLDSIPVGGRFRIMIETGTASDGDGIPVDVQVAGDEPALTVLAKPSGGDGLFLTPPITVTEDGLQ